MFHVKHDLTITLLQFSLLFTASGIDDGRIRTSCVWRIFDAQSPSWFRRFLLRRYRISIRIPACKHADTYAYSIPVNSNAGWSILHKLRQQSRRWWHWDRPSEFAPPRDSPDYSTRRWKGICGQTKAPRKFYVMGIVPTITWQWLERSYLLWKSLQYDKI